MQRNRKLVHGVGVNDSDYPVQPKENNIQSTCPYYRKWKGVLERVYSSKLHQKFPTYKNASICDEWLSFMTFKAWMEKQSWKGKDLDKDIIKPGNKVYSPEFCCFIPRVINNLFVGRGKRGYSWSATTKRYYSTCCHDGEAYNLGYFDNEEDARAAYVKFKSNLLISLSRQQTDPRIETGLRAHAELLNQKAIGLANDESTFERRG